MQTSAMGDLPHVLIVSGSVGAGHDGAARELAARLACAGVPVDVRDHLDALPRPIRWILRRGYTGSIRHRPAALEWLFDRAERADWMATVIRVLCWWARRRVLSWCAGSALVVSVFPFASQTLGQLREAGLLGVPVVTYLTDPAPHRLWLHPAVDHHWTVTEATVEAGARDYAVAMRAVGGLAAPAFAARPSQLRRAALRQELGLSTFGPVVLVATGSDGMGEIRPTVAALGNADIADIVVLCGRNEKLRAELNLLPRVVALGWRGDVAEIMATADVLVHNAGGLSLTEAFTSGLPAITYRPIPGHGRANAAVLQAAGLAPWPRDDQELVAEVARCCDGPRDGARSAGVDADPTAAVLGLLGLAPLPGTVVAS